ncbi:hypothetical protein [Herbidospora mongoliensis]|uniref:hypothetical protein n=1 Tax=Herbidospora mongoliensis TaxID=688067 RepID=UPI0008317CFF|nr:hypothetical protein [Herbidospora mongoliensis]
MSEHRPTPKLVTEQAEEIPGYTYATSEAASTPGAMEDLERLKAVVDLTEEDESVLVDAAAVPADQADDMVTAYRERLGEMPFMRPHFGHPDSSANPEYGAASKP